MLKQTLKQFKSAEPKKKKKKKDNWASVKKISQALEIKKSTFVLGLSLIEMQNKEFIFGPILSKVALLQCKTTPRKKCQFKISNGKVGSKESINKYKRLRSVLHHCNSFYFSHKKIYLLTF